MVAEYPRPEAHPGIEPRPSLRRRVDQGIRTALPCLFVLLLIFVLSAPFDLPGESELMFGIAIGTVFFWSAHRPVSMPAWAVFLIGIVADLLGFGPPGTILLALLVVHGVANTWRYGLSRINFLLAWILLAILALFLSLFQWIMVCIGALRLMSPAPSLFQAALTIGIYPTLSVLFVWAHRAIVNPERV